MPQSIRSFCLLVLSATASIGSLLASPDASTEVPADLSPAQKEVLAFETERREAVARVDLVALDGMLSPDLVYVDAHGLERGKADYLQHLRTEGLKYNSYLLDHQTVRILEGVAVTTGIFHFNVDVKGKNSQGSQYYTAVYLRVGSRWQLLVWHPTSKPA